jgi:predicted Zn-dependent peptidase
MNYTKKDLGSFGMHFINTDKFKTITVKVVFHTPIEKELITKRNVLTDILLQSSKKYETRRDLTIKAEDLYAADVSTNNQRLGNYILTSFILQVLNDKYTEENNFEKSIEFLSEIVLNPDIEDNGFKEEKLSIVKNNTKIGIDSIKEDSSNYSLIRMTEAYDKNSPVSYRMVGYQEDLDKITKENLYDCYKNMIDNDYVDIFVVGDIDNTKTLEMFKKYFKFKKIKKKKAPYQLPEKQPRKRRLFARETIENSQSKLAIACPINKMSEYERNYPLVLANLILGGGTDSKLFKEVREQNSLCYTIHSSTNKLDNLMIIRAGIDKNNYEKTVELITKNLKDMQKGKFSESDINIAKQFYNSSLENIEESEFYIINEYLFEEILGIEPIRTRKYKMELVKKSEIVKASKKITMDIQIRKITT